MGRPGRLGWRRTSNGALLFGFAFLLASNASANSAMGLQSLAELVFGFFGIALLLLSAVLGVISWVSVLRPPSSVGGVFGRGFLGVSAVLAFGLGAVFMLMAAGSSLGGNLSAVAFFAAIVVTTLFLVVEFAIAGGLYARTHQQRQSRLARGLSVASYGLAGLLGLFGSTVGALLVIAVNVDDSKPRMNSETHGYKRGCENNEPSDCNMLGLRYQHGSGLPPDPKRAAAAFQKGCDLKLSIACHNLALMYSSGDGIPKDTARADQLHARSKELQKSEGQ